MNFTENSRNRGFTIVELLVVIVVIGILATITIVAYNGVQNRARATAALTNAQEVQSKAEVYASDTGNGSFPTNGTAFEGIATTDTASLSTGVKNLLGTTVPSAAAPTALIYYMCTTSGAKVGYWDVSLPTPALVYLYMGTATSATACSAAG